MSLDPQLAQIDDYHGGPRFYPPGQHPATARMRDHLHLIREYADLRPDDPYCRRMITYLEDQLAMFDEMESEVKQRTLYELNRRSPR